jgi:phosphoserine phosphatase
MYFSERFEELSAGTDLNISIKQFTGGLRKSSKSWLSFIFVGPDQPGLIATFSDYAGKNNANIHKLKMISRGQIIACESLLDISGIEISREIFIDNLKSLGSDLGLQIIVESEDIFKKKSKKLMVLDLSENLIQIQGFSQFLNDISLEKNKQITRQFKSRKLGSELKEYCLNNLKGIKIDKLIKIISQIVISPGTEEFIRALKLMQYSIALISGSLSIFTDFLKKSLNLEYSFGNAIEIEEGIITGKYIKNLKIDHAKKLQLINWLASMEKIPEEEVVQFGLDEFDKDNFLSQSADLKINITFNYKSLIKAIQDGKFTPDQILSLFIIIGMQESQIEEIFNF